MVAVGGEVSNRKPVLSGVPQGSCGHIFFLIIYINDLEEGVTSKILKFADDTFCRRIKGNGDKQQLQDDPFLGRGESEIANFHPVTSCKGTLCMVGARSSMGNLRITVHPCCP